MSTNPQAPQPIYVEQQFLEKMPLRTPLIAKGFIKKEDKVPHRVDLSLFINQDLVRVFINQSHPYFNWWKHEAPTRVYASIYFALTAPFEAKYGSFTGELYNFTPEAYEEPTVVRERELKRQLYGHLESVQHPSLKALWETFLFNEQLCRQFFHSPVTTEFGYSFKGGLATHTISMMDRIDSQLRAWSPRYYEAYTPSPLNRDLLKTAALFHDTGKMFAYELVEGEVTTTPAGHLLGKTGLSLQFLQQIYQEMILNHPELMLDGFELLELQHIIASANREQVYGALVTPKTLEAECFAYLDGLDTSIGHFHALERKKPEPGFTKFMGRQVYVSPYTGNYEELYERHESESQESTRQETSITEAPTIESVSDAPMTTDLDFDISYNIESDALLEDKSSDDEEMFIEASDEDETEDVVSDTIEDAEEELDYEEDLTYEPDPMFQMNDSISTISVEPMPSIEMPSMAPLQTPFIGEVSHAMTNTEIHPTFMTPVMNIPAEWPETPSTAPVLTNGLPPQVIIPIQQSMSTPTPTVQPLPDLPPLPTAVTPEPTLGTPNPFSVGLDSTIPPLPPLPPLTPFNPETAPAVEEVETPKPKKTTTRKSTKSTKSAKSTEEDTSTEPKKATKSTKTTKSTKASSSKKSTRSTTPTVEVEPIEEPAV